MRFVVSLFPINKLLESRERISPCKSVSSNGQVLNAKGETVSGLYSAGEACGFGGGGYHGYNALEGTFLGGCIFSGRTIGRAMMRG